jgi:murein L,D-transpeptidase YcbB/YkuD
MTEQETTAKLIYSLLISNGCNSIGACAMLGNMQAESALRANNAQDGMTSLSDEDYTAGVDNGTYTEFVTDSVGYGLCQWTYKTRKQALLAYAQSIGASIGDTVTQVKFCIKELKESYSTVWNLMCTGTDLGTVAGIICTQYERPAVNNIAARTKFAQAWYACVDTWGAETVAASTGTITTSDVSYDVKLGLMKQGMTNNQVQTIQLLLAGYGYFTGKVSGTFDELTKRAVMGFQADFGLTTDGEVGGQTWAKLLKG